MRRSKFPVSNLFARVHFLFLRAFNNYFFHLIFFSPHFLPLPFSSRLIFSLLFFSSFHILFFSLLFSSFHFFSYLFISSTLLFFSFHFFYSSFLFYSFLLFSLLILSHLIPSLLFFPHIVSPGNMWSCPHHTGCVACGKSASAVGFLFRCTMCPNAHCEDCREGDQEVGVVCFIRVCVYFEMKDCDGTNVLKISLSLIFINLDCRRECYLERSRLPTYG